MRLITFASAFVAGLAAAVGLAACMVNAPGGAGPSIDDIGGYELPSIQHGRRGGGFRGMIEDLAGARAVVVGESHDRYDHHLSQLEIIKRLHQRRGRIAIGMEQFQQPFQDALDRYVSGGIDTEAMLIGTEYYQRWKYDFRLYEPILSYARENGIPVIALNLPAELTRRVAVEGLDALDPNESARIPELDRSDEAYRQRLKEVFDEHPTSRHGGSFEKFYTVQLLWDEGMAARAAQYLQAHPGDTLVVLAGEGHVEHGSGIPGRLARRIDGEVLSVVHGDGGSESAARGDYVLGSKPVELPERGLLGVIIDPRADGARVEELADGGAAAAAGIEAGDVIRAVDGHPVGKLAELKARLWDKRPGDRVTVTLETKSGGTRRLELELR